MYIKRSALEPDLFEVWDGEACIEEISASFPLKKWPKSFDSLEQIKLWLKEIEAKLARLTAYRLIAMRNYPGAVVLRKLQEKGYSESVSQTIVEELKRAGYIQDGEWIEQTVLREFRKGCGPRLIEMKLRSKGIASAQVRKLISPEMQREKIREILKKFPKEKASRMLQRKGFDFDLILQEQR